MLPWTFELIQQDFRKDIEREWDLRSGARGGRRMVKGREVERDINSGRERDGEKQNEDRRKRGEKRGRRG